VNELALWIQLCPSCNQVEVGFENHDLTAFDCGYPIVQYALLTLTEDGVSLFFMCAIVFFLESKFEKKNG
jgi:hypothetical protein